MPKVKVTLPDDEIFKGQIVEVDLEAIEMPDGFVSPEELRNSYVPKTNVEKDVKKRLAQQAEQLRKEYFEDDEFARELMIARNVPLDEEGNISLPDAGISAEEMAKKVQEQVQLQRHNWEKRELGPVQSKFEQALKQVSDLNRRILHTEILEAARKANVRPEKFEALPGTPTDRIPVIAQTEYRFGFDNETNHWALKSGDGFAINPEDDPNRPYAGPAELFDMLKSDPKVASSWFIDDRAEGTDIGKTTKTKDKAPGDVTDTERAQQLQKLQTTF